MFVGVELRGRSRPNTLIIPRSALHGQHVYVLNQENRLETRAITTGVAGASYYSVTDGLEAGEKIIVSDLVPAIEGMLLHPIDDPETTARLLAAASNQQGKEP